MTDSHIALTEQLAIAEEALKKISREFDTLCYAISHDLRAPLRILTGFAQALEEDFKDQLGGDGGDYVSRIHQNANKLDEMVLALVNLSKMACTPIQYQLVHLSEIVEEAVAAAKQTEPDRRLTTEVEQELWTTGDEMMIRNAIFALIDNAVKFTRFKTETKIVIARKADAPSLTFFVKDNGIGFDSAYADRLFGPFQRLHSDEAFPGVGMGLATTQRIIHRHGGHLYAEASPDEGATFYVFLPGDGN